MFVSKPRKVSLTLFCYLALVLAIVGVAKADTTNHARDHAGLSRMLKKRSPDGLGLPSALPVPPGLATNGAAGDPPNLDPPASSSSEASSAPSAAPSSTDQSQSSSSASAASASSSAASDSSSASSASSAASSASSASSNASGSSSSSASASASSTSSSTSASVKTTPPPSNSDKNQPATPDNDDDSSSQKAPSRVTATVAVTGSNAPSDTPAPELSGAATSVPKTALTVIIVIASCLGAVAIGWTVIRKWKFKPSSSFEDRMAPIDWQPSNAADDGIPGLRRNGSTASHGSFHSSGHSDENFAGRGVGNGYGSTSLQPLPEHDFTAGAATLAPVGGYADLARGPSPQPQMAELQRGPSVNRGYDSYGVPLHHQGAYDYNGSTRY